MLIPFDSYHQPPQPCTRNTNFCALLFTKSQVKLEEVDVKSGEEEEETMCSFKSKLFLFGETVLDKGTGVKTWARRGNGDARILRHRNHKRLRFLMRQENTWKVIANHLLGPQIELEPKAGCDKTWVWSCLDFSDEIITGEERTFALRLANSVDAQTFYDKYQELLAGGDKSYVGGEVADVADALSGLTTSDK